MKPDLGNTCDYYSEDGDWGKCDVPCGSEGSLMTHLWENPQEHQLAAYTVTIWGDLRDYDDVEEIAAYLQRVTDGKMVRNGVATVEVEGRQPTILIYRENGWARGTCADVDTL
ncbi:hypothetical protein [Roseibium sp. Sym1]|uniref:hypothetical protein n=1 Tax=Roseibium sp. Sym1 TaxID=3016006 RepID=UPI0022B4E3C3|nr:hypothetical protein [Roseibium sp. Sym1]